MSCLMINDIDAGLGRFGESLLHLELKVIVQWWSLWYGDRSPLSFPRFKSTSNHITYHMIFKNESDWAATVWFSTAFFFSWLFSMGFLLVSFLNFVWNHMTRAYSMVFMIYMLLCNTCAGLILITSQIYQSIDVYR